jgi:hypothetical protein
MFMWDVNSAEWRLIGPTGSFDNSETLDAPVPVHSVWEVAKITDLSPVPQPRTIWRLVIQGVLVAIWARETFNAGIQGFQNPIVAGINLPINHVLSGTAQKALVSDNSLAFGGLPVSRYMRTDISNQPDADAVRSLGSQSRRYASVHANLFVGTATQAQSATNAQNAVDAINAENADDALMLAGEPASFYQNATNITSGSLNVARLPYTPVNKAGDTMVGALTLPGDPTLNLQATTKQYVDTQITQRTLTQYESGQFNISNSGVIQLSHGLDVVPDFVTISLICLISDAGFNPGDQIEIASQTHPANVGLTLRKTNTQLLIYIGSGGVAHQIRGDGSGTSVTLTTTSWRMQVRAWVRSS